MFNLEGVYFRETPETARKPKERKFRIGEPDGINYADAKRREQAAIDSLRAKLGL